MKLTDIPDFWNKYLAEWDKNPTTYAKCEKRNLRYFKYSRALYSGIDYLPEPYYGDLTNPICVILDLNPGMSSPYDYKKLRSIGGCIYSFFHTHDYSAINAAYSPFLPSLLSRIGTPCEIPGVQWWNVNRMKWIESFIERYTGAPLPYPDRQPLALELCPWHSKSWSKDIIKDMSQFLDEIVFEPAAEAILKSRLIPFGLCFGKDIGEELQRLHYVVKKEWSASKPTEAWPEGRGDKRIDRTYLLLEGTVKNKKTYFLNLFSKGTYKAPSKEFQNKVEPDIIRYLKHI